MTEQTRVIKIDGMTCSNCAKSVHSVVSQLDGVQTIAVSLEQQQATATFDDSKVSAEKIAATIEDAGFDAQVASA